VAAVHNNNNNNKVTNVIKSVYDNYAVDESKKTSAKCRRCTCNLGDDQHRLSGIYRQQLSLTTTASNNWSWFAIDY